MAAERPTTHGVIVSGWREGGRERAQGIACLLPSFQPARYRNTHHLGFNGVRTERAIGGQLSVISIYRDGDQQAGDGLTCFSRKEGRKGGRRVRGGNVTCIYIYTRGRA
jgi:hypothetical protein